MALIASALNCSVSIHTRHYWRVKQRLRYRIRQVAGVSIHTRHYWRVKPCRAFFAGRG